MRAPLDDIVPGVLARQPRALGRAISILEDGGEGQRELIRRIYPTTFALPVAG